MPAMPLTAHGQETGAPAQVAAPEGTSGPLTGGRGGDPLPVRLGGIGFPYTALQGEPGDPGRTWYFTPSIGIDVIATNNLFQTARDRRSEIYTRIAPSLVFVADTPNLVADIRYAPSIFLHPTYSSENRINHLLSAQATATLVPERVFLDIRAFSGLQAASGGFAPEAGGSASRNNQIQTYDMRVAPYAVLRFGSAAIAHFGYDFIFSDRNGNAQFVGGQAQPVFVSQSFSAHRGYLVLRSGEDFGRVALLGRLDGTKFIGTGIYDDAHRASAYVEARYAITRNFAVLAGGGYESQAFNGAPRIRIDEPIWSVGTRLSSATGSSIVLRYGRRDGFNSAFVDGNVQLGGRTALQVRYSDTLTTSGLLTQDLLTSTAVDDLGNPIDAQAGARIPFSPILYSNSLLAAQSSLMRVRLGTAFLSYSWPRDTISVGLVYQDQEPVSVNPGTSAFAQSGISGAVTWWRELTPNLSSVAYVQYGRTTSRVSGDGEILTASGALVQRLARNLVASVQVLLTQRWNERPGTDVSTAMIIAGVRQSF